VTCRLIGSGDRIEPRLVAILIVRGIRPLARGWCSSEPRDDGGLFAFARERLAPYKRSRRIVFCQLPRTILGDIQRVELHKEEVGRIGATALADGQGPEYREEDIAT
jgi:acyl-coenzyme A synthetase/AMP-(fatty) acid ligase